MRIRVRDVMPLVVIARDKIRRAIDTPGRLMVERDDFHIGIFLGLINLQQNG